MQENRLYVPSLTETTRALTFHRTVDFIDLHPAHGYLLHQFLSPLSNNRTDELGSRPLGNRLRFPLQIIRRVREGWSDKPLFVRVSASDWAEGPEQGEDGT